MGTFGYFSFQNDDIWDIMIGYQDNDGFLTFESIDAMCTEFENSMANPSMILGCVMYSLSRKIRPSTKVMGMAIDHANYLSDCYSHLTSYDDPELRRLHLLREIKILTIALMGDETEMREKMPDLFMEIVKT